MKESSLALYEDELLTKAHYTSHYSMYQKGEACISKGETFFSTVSLHRGDVNFSSHVISCSEDTKKDGTYINILGTKSVR